LTFNEQQYLVKDNTSPSAKRQEMLEIWGPCHLAMPLPADNLLGPYGRPSACGHHMIFLECFFQHVIWYGPKSEKLIDAHKAEILVKYTDCAEL